MSWEIPGYQISETLFDNNRTAIRRAVREEDGTSVILKQLVSPFPPPGQLSRFSFSYEVLSKFDHPNIVKPLAWHGSKKKAESTLTPTLESAPTMVLEDQRGIDLFAYLKTFKTGQLPVDAFLNIAVQLAEALSVIHYHQVIHKDLHPGNILINVKSGLTQITDFGLASLLSREQPLLDAPDKLEGVLEYISPEQTGRMNRAVDYRSDFYTLGATFYHLLSGHPPFKADDALGMVHAHIAKPHEPLVNVREDIPPILSAIVDKLLNKTAEDRYQSALGLKKDLMNIQGAVSTNKPVPEFPLGMDDISDRFQVPQKLYGRDDEVELLMKRFFSAAGGKPRMLAIAGYSGIGKSALVHEVHKPIAAYNGLFCSGKFDQFQKNVPYSALQSALKSWVQYTLSLSEQRLSETREVLLEALGSNARVMIDFMPEFERILGSLPEVAALGADETQNRFHLVFQQFVKAITHERPLVLFIDDIQWADRGTLNLLPLLLTDEGSRLLLIVAYRNNEVDATHPAIQTLKYIENAPVISGELSRIVLGPLELDEVSQLLQDALHRPKDEVAPLVEMVHRKTAGNPFFIGEFLKTLYTENLLDFDLTRQRWVWDIEEIEAKGITDNVVELMLGKMATLPEDTQAMIQLAACVGSRFDLEMLAKVAEQPLTVVTRQLWPALRDGLLLQDGGDWYLGIVGQDEALMPIRSDEDHVLSQSSPMSPQCKFLHDRMLQAAYQSMSEDKRQVTHLRVGRLLLKYCVTEMTDDDCFAIVEQFNSALPLLTDAQERLQVSKLNLRAAKQAWAASVWEAAADYSEIGIQLLSENKWSEEDALTQALFKIKAESEYLIGNGSLSAKLYDELFEYLDDVLEKADICSSRLVQDIGKGEWQKGIDHALQGFGFLKVVVPNEDELEHALSKEQELFGELTDQKFLLDFTKLPEMDDRQQLIVMKILPNVSACSLIFGQPRLHLYFLLFGINLAIRYGKSDLLAIILAAYAMYLRSQGELELATKIGEQSKEIADSYLNCREISNCYNIYGGSIYQLRWPYKRCVSLQVKGMELGLQNGELARAAMNRCNSLFVKMTMGAPLSALASDAHEAEVFAERCNAFHPAPVIVKNVCEILLKERQLSERLLGDEAFNSEFLAKVTKSYHYAILLHNRAMVAFWSENEEAIEWCRKFQEFKPVPEASFVSDHFFYLGFLLATSCQRLNDQDKDMLDQCLTFFQKYTEIYTPNFRAKYLLLQAEVARREKESSDKVCILYSDAIVSAEEQDFIHLQALATERMGDYWLEKGVRIVAIPLLQEAVYLYKRWECQARVSVLRKKYEGILPIFENKKTVTISHSETRDSQEAQTLDMASVMKSAQLISKELQLTKLSAKVLEVIVECAGASAGALVINQAENSLVVALTDNERELIIPDQDLLLEDCSELPVNIVRYVLNSDESVNVGDLFKEQAFANDPYIIKNPPKSLLCVPVNYRESTIGALYLENTLSIEAFTEDRLDVIHLLLAQAAISFENAQLFDEVNQLNQNLEEKVEQRTADLNRAVEQLERTNEELNAFSHTVSHDLRAPVRCISNFTAMLAEDYEPVLDDAGKRLINRIINNSDKMHELIEGLLALSRLQKQELTLHEVSLSDMVSGLYEEMRERFPTQRVNARFVENCMVQGDKTMLYSALENLVNNAWKYSSKTAISEVEFGFLDVSEHGIPEGIGGKPESLPEGTPIYFVKDNGAGFNMANAQKLFGSFQRMHSEKEFQGTGVGLATVKRVFEKHGGNIWVYATQGEGATFYFTCNVN